MSLASRPSLSRSAELRLGLMALASSGGYSMVFCTVSLPLGMMDVPEKRDLSLGRSAQHLLGRSSSDSEDELEGVEVCDVAPADMAGLGCGGIAVVEGLSDAIPPAKGRLWRRTASA